MPMTSYYRFMNLIIKELLLDMVLLVTSELDRIQAYPVVFKSLTLGGMGEFWIMISACRFTILPNTRIPGGIFMHF